jgi:hypothetical protein
MAKKKAKDERPDEVEDEYNLDLEADVQDESDEEASADTSFTITSYGADYTVDSIVARVKSEAFYVPKFQRKFVWSQRHASRFIESLLMGLPVPGIFLYKEPQTNRHLVVDGQQRLRTLQYFYEGLFQEKKFRLIGVQPEWEGKTYEELSGAEQLKLDDSIVHATIFQQDEPKDNQRSLYFVFERINSGGIRLSPQEIRNCIGDGPILDTVRLLNNDDNWRAIIGERRNPRLKDQELVLRVMAMIEWRDKYASPMRDFLNDFVSNGSTEPQVLKRLQTLFKESIKLCNEAKGKNAFRPSRALNAAVFEAVMVGLASRLTKNKSAPDITKFNMAYDALLTNKEFLRSCEYATAREDSVATRQSEAIKAFASI